MYWSSWGPAAVWEHADVHYVTNVKPGMRKAPTMRTDIALLMRLNKVRLTVSDGIFYRHVTTAPRARKAEISNSIKT
jgi:hypothetical protein